MALEEHLVIKELGDVIVETRDHTVTLFVPVEVLNIRRINDINDTNFVTNDINDTNFLTNDGTILTLKMTLIFMMITCYDGKDDDDKDDDDEAYISYTHIDPKGRKLRFATPLGKVNILKMIKMSD